MKLQPTVNENPDDVRFLSNTIKGWKTRMALTKPKTLAPMHTLTPGAIPNTPTVVSTPMILTITLRNLE